MTEKYIIIEDNELDDHRTSLSFLRTERSFLKDVICYVDTEKEAQEIVKTLHDKYWCSRPRVNFYYESIIPWKDIERYYFPENGH